MTFNSFEINGIQFRLVTRICNKPKCKCKNGQPHGPYWYANGTKYIGKELPKEILVYLAQLKEKQETMNKLAKYYREEYNRLQKLAEKADDTSRAIYQLVHGQTIEFEYLPKELQEFRKLADKLF